MGQYKKYFKKNIKGYKFKKYRKNKLVKLENDEELEEKNHSRIYPTGLKEHQKYVLVDEKYFKSPDLLLEKIKEWINQLFFYFENYDPIDLLTHLGMKFLKFDPNTETEITSSRKEHAVEYILSLASSISESGIETISNEMDIVENLINKILENSLHFYMLESINSSLTPENKLLRFQLISKTMVVRGDAYGPHYLDMIQGIFTSQNQNLIDELGVSIENIIKTVSNIKEQINDNGKNPKNPIIANFLKVRSGEINIEQARTIISNLNLKTKDEQDELFRKYSIFKIKPIGDKEKIVYELFSSTYGENEIFIKNEEYDGFIKGWPLNESIIFHKPIFKDRKERYFGFCSSIFLGNLYEMIYTNLSQRLKLKIDKAKSDYLENTIEMYFGKIFPDEKIHKNLYYKITENNKEKLAECDGLIIYDNKVFLIEAKSKKVKESVHRGSIVQFKRSMDKIVNAAYEQALRTKKFIQSVEKAEFFDKKGDLILTVTSKNIEKFYLVNLTSELLSPISTQLHILKNYGLIQQKDWIWSIYVNDLRIISELIESPCEFILYLDRRLELNDKKSIYTSDEIDYFGFFLETGLYFDDKFDGRDKYLLIGYGEKIDNYFYHKFGYRSSGPKPKFNIEKDYWELIHYFERTRKPYFSEIALILLKMNSTEILEIIKEIKKRSIEKRRYSHAFLLYSDFDFCINISIRPKSQELDLETELGYISLRKYKHKISKAIMLAGFYENEELEWDYGFLEYEWKFDPEIEKLVKNVNLPDNSNFKFKR